MKKRAEIKIQKQEFIGIQTIISMLNLKRSDYNKNALKELVMIEELLPKERLLLCYIWAYEHNDKDLF